MNDRFATWLDLATDSELASAYGRLFSLTKRETAAKVRLGTLIALTQRARNLRLAGRIEQAMRLEARRERMLGGAA